MGLMQSIAEKLMLLMPSAEPSSEDLSLNEIFRHDVYRKATPERQVQIRRASSEYRYAEENSKPFWTTYFSNYRLRNGSSPSAEADYAWHLRGRDILDFGCFTGGRGVHWAKQYGIARLYGCDINPIYIQAASEFATRSGIPNEYKVLNDDGTLPFPDEIVDTVVTFDVLEHVDDVERSMNEMLRVLRPGGYLFIVFPQFHQPFESHMGFVSHTPALQWFVPSKTLSGAFFSLIESRGNADWYKPDKQQAWEKLPCLNGTTNRQFHELIKRLPVEVVHITRDPILSHGVSYPKIRKHVVKPLFRAILSTRLFDEFLLDRVAVILRKKELNNPHSVLAEVAG